MLSSLYGQFKERGLEIVGVSFDRDEQPVREFIVNHGLNYPVYIGTPGLRAVQNISMLPTTVLVARDGSVAGRYVGIIPQENLKKEIRSLLAQKP